MTALVKTYKEAVHEVGVGNDGPHASNKIFKMIKKSRIALKISLKLKTKMKWNLNWFPYEIEFEMNFKFSFNKGV